MAMDNHGKTDAYGGMCGPFSQISHAVACPCLPHQSHHSPLSTPHLGIAFASDAPEEKFVTFLILFFSLWGKWGDRESSDFPVNPAISLFKATAQNLAVKPLRLSLSSVILLCGLFV